MLTEHMKRYCFHEGSWLIIVCFLYSLYIITKNPQLLLEPKYYIIFLILTGKYESMMDIKPIDTNKFLSLPYQIPKVLNNLL